MKRAPTPLPPATDAERNLARQAAGKLRQLIAAHTVGDIEAMKAIAGTPIRAHLLLARPRRGVWRTTWTNMPGFIREDRSASLVSYSHHLLPGWSYTRPELVTEMIPDLEKLAETGERPTEATR